MLHTFYSNPVSLIPIDMATMQVATKTLDIAAYSFVDAQLISAVLSRAAAGVAVRLYLDRTELESTARGDPALGHSPLRALLGVQGVAIRVKQSSILMHLKSYCVDGITLRDGSANFSAPGEEQQDNSLTLTDDLAAISLFVAKFNAMWARPDNLSVPQAILSSPAFARRPSHLGGARVPADSSMDSLT